MSLVLEVSPEGKLSWRKSSIDKCLDYARQLQKEGMVPPAAEILAKEKFNVPLESRAYRILSMAGTRSPRVEEIDKVVTSITDYRWVLVKVDSSDNDHYVFTYKCRHKFEYQLKTKTYAVVFEGDYFTIEEL
jgi:hypothetical protein